jgi:hypothetical protein
MTERADWMDWHPPPEHEQAERQAEDWCEQCARPVSVTCPACGDEVR